MASNNLIIGPEIARSDKYSNGLTIQKTGSQFVWKSNVSGI
jgi:hypothetical protein